MRATIAILSATTLIACQSAPQSETRAPGTTAGGTTAGSTTISRGTPTVSRSETTRASSGATLRLDRVSYAPGATVTMRITSETSDTLGFNQCSSRSVERQEGGNWVAHVEPDRMCTMELRLLMPRETQTATTDLPATVSPGTYRMVLTLSRQTARGGGGAVRAVSAPFRVT